MQLSRDCVSVGVFDIHHSDRKGLYLTMRHWSNNAFRGWFIQIEILKSDELAWNCSSHKIKSNFILDMPEVSIILLQIDEFLTVSDLLFIHTIDYSKPRYICLVLYFALVYLFSWWFACSVMCYSNNIWHSLW